jgi:hypothetical protein
LDSLCFRQIWPPHTKAAAVSASERRLIGARLRGWLTADTGRETANSAAATRRAADLRRARRISSCRNYRLAWDWIQSTGQPNGTSNLILASGSRRLHSRTCAASHLVDWEGQAADSGAAGRRTLRLQSLVSPQCRVIGESVLRPKTCAPGSNGLSGQGQRSVSTSSRRKAGLRRVRRLLHVCQARRAGPLDITAAGQPGRTAASVQISTTGFMSDHNQTLPSGGGLPVHWSNNSGYADSESRQGFSVCTRRREQRGA